MFWCHFVQFSGSGNKVHRLFPYRCRAPTYRCQGLKRAQGLLWVILGFLGAKMVQGSSYDGLKMAKDGLKMAKGDPKMAPRWPQDGL